MQKLRPSEQLVRAIDPQTLSEIASMRIMRTISDTKKSFSDTALFAYSYGCVRARSHAATKPETMTLPSSFPLTALWH